MKKSNTNSHSSNRPEPRETPGVRPAGVPVYPFSAIVGQDEMKLALVLNVINPAIGGVVIMGQRGTGKSTAVRALAELLPPLSVVKGCFYRCDPASEGDLCDDCMGRHLSGAKLQREWVRVGVVELPLGATEDRVCGTIDIERALREGKKTFDPGLLARANRGFLYIDEVNLLEDHLVDLLLDVAVTGRNKVERESMSVEHPARFVLIGSGNPEEGELRPQLLDRFGLHVEVQTENDLDARVEIVEQREAFDRDPVSFGAGLESSQQELRKKITRAQKNVAGVVLGRPLLLKIAQLCADLKIDGHRGELTISRAARALAALEGRKKVIEEDVRSVTTMALRHRLRRDPLEETASTEKIQQALERLFPEPQPSRKERSDDDGPGESRGRTGSVTNTNSSGSRGRAVSASGALGSEVPDKTIPITKENGLRAPDLPVNDHGRANSNLSFAPGRTQERGATQVRNSVRGRYVRATATNLDGARIAIDATLRAMVSSKSPASSLRYKQLSQKSGRLFIFAIDTSGSMAVHRIGQAKAAVLDLLRESYVRRDSVAIIGFRGNAAEVLLPPSRSILRARRALESLSVGGGTPLSAGLASALRIAKRAVGSEGEITVLLFSDGHANVALSSVSKPNRAGRQTTIARELTALGIEFKKVGVRVIVVDTQNSFTATRDAEAMADRLGAVYRQLPTAIK